MRLDQRNGNTLWEDAITLEVSQIGDYDTFIDNGHHTHVNEPSRYKKIRVHFVFDVKHDRRHKSRLVADGKLTQFTIDSVYSGVVSLRGFLPVLVQAKLSHRQIWVKDIGNAYLKVNTSERVCIIAGPDVLEYVFETCIMR
jgi:hypothetical protein